MNYHNYLPYGTTSMILFRCKLSYKMIPRYEIIECTHIHADVYGMYKI